MSTRCKWLHGHQVYRDSANMQRWLDVIGPNATKFIQNFTQLPIDDTTGDPTEYTTTVVEVGAGNSTIALTPAAGGNAVMTSAANENDGIQIQLNGEAFLMDDAYPLYCGCRFKVEDADQTDFLFGLCITDTTLLGGMTDGIYVQSVDGSAAITLELEKDSTATSTAIGTLTDDTFVIVEFVFDGTNVDCWVDGTLQTRPAVTNLPDDEELTPSLAMLTGEAVANTVTIDWFRCFQIRA